jgi:DNA polymerase-3 subunit delta'
LLASRIFSFSMLDASIQGWMQCREQLIHISSINRELLLINQILDYIE